MATWANGEGTKFSLESMRSQLHVARTACRRFDANLLLMRLECEYKQYIAGHSKAYLSGSPWYVGDSMVYFLEKHHLESEAIHLMVVAEEATEAPPNSTTPLKASMLRLVGNTLVVPRLHTRQYIN